MTTFGKVDGIELDYRAGVLPESAICAKHQISKKQLGKMAREGNWKRQAKGSVVVPIVRFPYQLEDVERVYVEQGPVPAAVQFDMPMASLLQIAADDGWVKKETAPSSLPPEEFGYPNARDETPRAVSLFKEEDIKRAALIASSAVVQTHRNDINRLRNLAHAAATGLEEYVEGKPASFTAMGERESFLDALGKATIIFEKVIRLEREAYGIKVDTQDQKEIDAYCKMDPLSRRKRIEELQARTSLAQIPSLNTASREG